jgi:molecular chaperone GrpE
MAEEYQNNELPPGEESPEGPQPVSESDVLKARIEELEQANAQLKDQLLRKAAEFENYKKRSENDYQSLIKYSNEELIAKLLPIVDDFERSLKMGRGDAIRLEESGDGASFVRGVELIYNKLLKTLELQGVKRFDSVGKEFDPSLHDALMMMPRSDVPPNTVVEEVEKGYMLHDKVIRHARVIVSTAEPIGDTRTESRDAGNANDNSNA